MLVCPCKAHHRNNTVIWNESCTPLFFSSTTDIKPSYANTQHRPKAAMGITRHNTLFVRDKI